MSKLEKEINAALKNERASVCNRKPLIKRPLSLAREKKGASLATLSNIWPTVKFCSELGSVTW